jgi:hypothetical protein
VSGSSSGTTTSSQTATSSANSGNGGGEGLQSCSNKTSLGFSYSQNSQGEYVVSSNSITLPCGAVQAYEGGEIPTQYLLVHFGVNTIGQPGAEPYFYNYQLYAVC